MLQKTKSAVTESKNIVSYIWINIQAALFEDLMQTSSHITCMGSVLYQLTMSIKDEMSQSNFVANSTISREISRSRRDKKDGGEQI